MKRVKVFLWFLLVCFSLPLMAQETEEQDSLQTEDLDLEESMTPSSAPVAMPWLRGIGLSPDWSCRRILLQLSYVWATGQYDGCAGTC